jgi:hypothetical protein
VSSTSPARRLTAEDLWTGFTTWLALTDDAFCRLSAEGAVMSLGLVPNVLPGGESFYGSATTFGLCGAQELVVFAPRGSYDVLVRRYGTHAGALGRMQSAIGAWDAAGRPGNARLRVHVDAAGTARAFYQ